MATTYHDIQADLMDRLATVKPDAEQHLLNSIMLSSVAIAIASDKAPDYRPAMRDAVKFARQAYRHALGLVSQSDNRRLMAQAARQPRNVTRRDAAGVWMDDQKTSNYVGD